MRWLSLGILSLAIVVSGCVAAVVAGAAGSLVVYDKRSVTMIERDARIFHRLHKAIVTDPRFADSHVEVTSFNGVVLLTGQTPTASLRGVLEKKGQSVPHIERLYNEVTIQDPVPLTQRSKDSWITGQVRAQMLAKKGLESGSIRVVTENSTVYLMGIATHPQADLAVHVARRVKGVEKVVKIFRYIN